MNLKVSQQILHSKGKKKKTPFLCQKLWTCWFSILRTKLLIYFLLLTNPKENCGPPGWPGPKGYEGQFPSSPWLAVQRFYATIYLFFIPWGLSAFANPIWKGQAWVRCMPPPSCPSHSPSSVSVSELWIVQKNLQP